MGVGSECFTWNQSPVEEAEVEIRSLLDPGDKMEIQQMIPDFSPLRRIAEDFEGVGSGG
jgi:hypothetical protein